MQTLEARAQYRNSLHCAYRIFTEEGLRRFWTGTTPRLVRLVVCLFFFLASLASLREGALDERGHSLHDLRKSHLGYWRARVIDMGNQYNANSFVLPLHVQLVYSKKVQRRQ